MEPVRLQEIIKVCRGKAVNCDGSLKVRGVSIDTRTIKRGDLFFALKGTRTDGHVFVKSALRKGARAAIVSKPVPGRYACIRVNDVCRALGDIAADYRNMFDVSVIGITGSNGKSTTKEMLRLVLSKRFKTVSSPASFNNFIGVPLTLFGISKKTQVLVQEMETNKIGGIRRLCRIARPRVGIVTNIGNTHLETLKTKNGVLKEKSELLASLPAGGVAVLNADDDSFCKLKKCFSPKKTITYGIKKNCMFKARTLNYTRGIFSFTVGGVRIRLKTSSYYNIYNALAALSCASGAYGMGMRSAAVRLRDFAPLPLRSRLRVYKGITVINDCFNANPDSVKAALDALRVFPQKRKWALLGDMLELGTVSKKLHYMTGALCVKEGLHGVVCVGRNTRFIARGAREAGMDPEKITYCKTPGEAVQSLITSLEPGDLLLVKASRAMRLEEAVNELRRKL